MFSKIRIAVYAIVLCSCSAVLAQPVHPRLAAEVSIPGTTIFEYSPDTGDLHVYQDAKAEFEITALEITSDSNSFLYSSCPFEPVDCFLFDVFRTDKLFRLDQGGYGEVTFPAALPMGLTHEFLVNDLNVDGAIFLGGKFSDVVLLVPEPNGVGMVCLGMFGLLARRRRN